MRRPKRVRPPARASTGVTVPAPASSFVGREREVEALGALLARGARIVTVVGPAGVGKTRLVTHAAEAARSSLGGPAAVGLFCDLSESGTAADVVTAIRSALGAALTPVADEIAHLARLLARRGAVLLIVDNLEQVVAEAAPLLARLLAGTPRLRVLATSRQRLRLRGEMVLDLEPLPVPPPGAASPERYAAVRLLLDCARAVAPEWASAPGDTDVVAAVARRLEGFPLAIELTAPRSRVLDPAALLARLEQGFDVVGAGARDAGARHATLARAINWSVQLLAPVERDALAQCSVFAGSFTPAAAEAVLDLGPGAPPVLDVLAALVDQSLVRAGGGGRLALYASVREHAALALAAAGGAEAAVARHARAYLALGEELARDVERRGSEARRALAPERDQLAAVHARSLAPPARVSDALRAALLLDEITAGQGPVREQLAPIDAALRAAEGAGVDAALLSRAHEARAGALRAAGRGEDARRDLERALALALQAGDRAAEARARSALCVQLRSDRQLDAARAQGALALALHREHGLSRFEIFSLGALGAIELEAGRLDAALPLLERSASLARRTGDCWSEAMAVACLGHAHQERRALPEARAAFSRAAAVFGDLGDLQHEAIFEGYLAGVLHEEGDRESARAAYARAVARLAELGVARFEGLFRACLGAVTAELGAPVEAEAELAIAAEHLARAADPALLLALEIRSLAPRSRGPGRRLDGDREARRSRRRLAARRVVRRRPLRAPHPPARPRRRVRAGDLGRSPRRPRGALVRAPERRARPAPAQAIAAPDPRGARRHAAPRAGARPRRRRAPRRGLARPARARRRRRASRPRGGRRAARARPAPPPAEPRRRLPPRSCRGRRAGRRDLTFFDSTARRRCRTSWRMHTAALVTRLFASIGLAAALTDCTSWKLVEPAAALAPFAPPPPDLAQICIVRTALLGQAVTFPVHDGGVLVGATRGRSHFCYLAAPGHHVITIEADEIERAEVDVQPGSRRYLKQEVDNIFGHVRCRAVWITEAVARELVLASTYRVLVGVPGTERLPDEPPVAPATMAGR